MRKYNPINSKVAIDESGKVTFKEEGPCWPGYKQVGTKMKNGKQVPNCVPVSEAEALEKELGLQLDEAPLVMSDMDMASALFKDIKDSMMKNTRSKNREKNWPMLQQLAAMAGYGITKKGQSKEKSFRYDLKKK